MVWGHGIQVDLIDTISLKPNKGVIMVGRFGFNGDGMDIPYNTPLAATGRKARKSREVMLD